MRKLFALLSVAAVVSLASCGGKTEKVEGTDTTSSVVAPADSTPVVAPADSAAAAPADTTKPATEEKK